jgi:hypothetical protein
MNSQTSGYIQGVRIVEEREEKRQEDPEGKRIPPHRLTS